MKIKLTKALVAIFSIIFALTSCDKNEDGLASVASNKQDILTFATVDEFNSTVQKVNAMKPEERSTWEKSKGFKSFGTICDEFYATIEPDKFKNKVEFLEYIKLNSDFVQIIEHSDSSQCLETSEFDNTSRYLMNKNRMYIIGNMAYKKFNEGCIATALSNIATLTTIKDFNSLKANQAFTVLSATPKKIRQKISSLKTKNQNESVTTLGNDYGDWAQGWGWKGLYRLEIYLRTSNSYNILLFNTYRNATCQIQNYLKGTWGIFYGCNCITTWDVSLYTSDSANNQYNYFDKQNSITVMAYSAPFPDRFICGGTTTVQAFFTGLVHSAHNDENCSLSHTY